MAIKKTLPQFAKLIHIDLKIWPSSRAIFNKKSLWHRFTMEPTRYAGVFQMAFLVFEKWKLHSLSWPSLFTQIPFRISRRIQVFCDLSFRLKSWRVNLVFNYLRRILHQSRRIDSPLFNRCSSTATPMRLPRARNSFGIAGNSQVRFHKIAYGSKPNPCRSLRCRHYHRAGCGADCSSAFLYLDHPGIFQMDD